MERYNIFSNGESWALKREGASRATKIYKKKADAKNGAKPFRNRGFEIVVHKENGMIEEWLKGKKK